MTMAQQTNFGSFVIFAFLLSALHAYNTSPCKHRKMTQQYLATDGKELQRVSYRQTVAKSSVQCVRDCHADPDCTSVNYKSQTQRCSLNNGTRAQFPEHFITHCGIMYFDSSVSTPFHVGPQQYNSCKELLEDCHNVSGVYTIWPAWTKHGLSVYCDIETDGGGWIVIQRRQDDSVDFYRNWADYQVGFGTLSGDFWIGNGNLRNLTETTGNWQLRVDMTDWVNGTAFTEYEDFRISGDNYRLTVGPYNNISTAGDSLSTVHNDMLFSTKDKDNDKDKRHCATTFQGAWWYNDCYQSNLNGIYFQGEVSKSTGIKWTSWKGLNNLKLCDLKIRPS